MAERQQSQMVINPRGIRPAYVRNDVFFQALPTVLKAIPSTRVFCSAMRGQPDAEKYMTQFGLGSQVMLLDNELQPDLWRRYAGCNVLVTPAIHDGTPNSLLEGMAFGCLPVVGKIEFIQEWITDGENGILVDPNDADFVANGIIRGLSDRPLQERAAEFNWNLILERVDRVKVMQQVDDVLIKSELITPFLIIDILLALRNYPSFSIPFQRKGTVFWKRERRKAAFPLPDANHL